MDQAALRIFVGIDWGSESHRVCALDREGEPLGERRVEHTAKAVEELAHWLLGLAGEEAGAVGVAVELPRGALVETLAERGFALFFLNPKRMDRFRDRFSVAGAKDDRRDALVLADSLRTDRRLFHPVRPDHPLVVQLREASRTGDEAQQEFTREANRLRDLLYRLSPQLLSLCPGADEPWLWALLQRAPTPQGARRLRPSTLQALLKAHRIRRISAEELHRLLQEPPLPLAPGAPQAIARRIALLLPRLRLLHQQQRDCQKWVEELVEALAQAEHTQGEGREHRDLQILRDWPAVGTRTLATMLAEASQPLAHRDYSTLRLLGGLAPVTKRSGKRHSVHIRRACNKRLRQAFYYWAQNAIRLDPAARRHYQRLRQRGHSYPRALRGVMDRILAALCAALRDGSLYDPHRRQHPKPLTTQEVSTTQMAASFS